MRSVLTIGSLNLDYVYQVPHFVRPGETLEASSRSIHIGGKGLNQSAALARAGVSVFHCGAIGEDGALLKAHLEHEGVNADFVRGAAARPSGHTVIQVTPEGENSILYFPGTNETLEEAEILSAVRGMEAGDLLLMQNETNGIAQAADAAISLGMHVVFNPAPWKDAAAELPIERFHALIVNETEAAGLLKAHGRGADSPEAVVESLGALYPRTTIILTLGSEGAMWRLPGRSPRRQPAFRVEAVDTTGAGDTFTGYAVRAMIEALDAGDPEAGATLFADGIYRAAMAAAISVTKPGAAESVPTLEEVEAALEAHEAE